MILFGPLRSIHAVAWDAFQAMMRFVPGYVPLCNLITQRKPRRKGVPVFVMLPLDTACEDREMPSDEFEEALKVLADIGVRGIMVDVWWGLCEPEPSQYSFEKYVELMKLCKRVGLKVQATMSFHACGGNVGDTINIPLPSWVLEAGNRHEVWFTDRSGSVNREYISFGADHELFLPMTAEGPTAVLNAATEQGNMADRTASPEIEPRVSQRLRTPLQAYGSFVRAFVEIMDAELLMGSTIVELQIGVGPCGELRYPSYSMAEGKWQFPGIGEFQCFDKFLLKDLQSNIREKGSEVVKRAQLPPDDTGSYNDTPWNTRFFRKGFKTDEGAFFLHWYCSRMLEHGEDVLKQVRSVVPITNKSVALAVKISGIHWWRFTASRPAEATAGYVMSQGKTAYREIAKLLRSYGVIFDFTCLEMRTIDQPFFKARCGPRQLVAEVFAEAEREGVPIAGENALERYDWRAYEQVLSAYRLCPAVRYGFTLLRLGRTLMEAENVRKLSRFVETMNQIE